MTREQVITKLIKFIDSKYNTLSAYAKDRGIHPQVVTNVLNGAKEPSNYMLHDIGIVKTKVTVYSKIK